MPDNKEALSSPRAKGNKALIPPANLWDALEQARTQTMPEPPEGSFSIEEYRIRFNIATTARASGEIRRLVRDGKIREVGRFGSRNEYMYTLVTP